MTLRWVPLVCLGLALVGCTVGTAEPAAAPDRLANLTGAVASPQLTDAEAIRCASVDAHQHAVYAWLVAPW